MKQTVHWLRGMTQFFRGKGSGHLAGKERVSSRQSQEGQQSRARMGKNRPDSQEGAPGREENTRASNWLREVVEAISIALILAFLFRAFGAEAFVIPTGSMAPTLMGRHKDLICERCGFSFQTGASEEVDKLTNRPTGRFVLSATCPNCRYTMYVGPNKDDGPPTPSYKGDRILVSKYEYHLSEPRRWDVIVFKYPGDASTNFIKRLVGLPNETVRIYRGDVYIRPAGSDQFAIARKPPEKILALLQPVYMDDFQSPELKAAGWPDRWQPEVGQQGLWEIGENPRQYRVTAPEDMEVWLRYQHIVPSWEHWQAILEGNPIDAKQVSPQLISDFMAYNTNQSDESDYGPHTLRTVRIPPRGDQLGLHWVSDLAVECEADMESDGGEIILELGAGKNRYQARLNLADGVARFIGMGLRSFSEEAPIHIHGRGHYQLRFANVDHQLVLWVNGRPITVEYEAVWSGPTLDDRDRPARIGVRGGTVTIRHVRLFRDVYYIAHDRRSGLLMHDFDWERSPYRSLIPSPFAMDQFRQMVAEVMSDPTQWEFFQYANHLEFALGPDQFFVLGDNSPQSEDGRFWTKKSYVQRELLVGKALAVIWPHSLDRIPGTKIPIRFFPNFWRMKVVR